MATQPRPAAQPGRLLWRVGEVFEVVEETPTTKSLVLSVPGWEGHKAGQHVDVRLTAEDGYQVQRSYSIASAPEDERLAITVDRIEDGEVSPYLTEDLVAGDGLELRGPIGGYFVWERGLGGPLLLVAGPCSASPPTTRARWGSPSAGQDHPTPPASRHRGSRSASSCTGSAGRADASRPGRGGGRPP